MTSFACVRESLLRMALVAGCKGAAAGPRIFQRQTAAADETGG